MVRAFDLEIKKTGVREQRIVKTNAVTQQIECHRNDHAMQYRRLDSMPPLTDSLTFYAASNV